MDPNNVEVYLVDDERNAPPRVVDHRRLPVVVRQPQPVRPPQPYPAAAAYPQPSPVYGQPYPYAQRPPVVIVQQSRRPSALGPVLSTIKVGAVIKNVAGMLVAAQSLPEAPVAAGSDVHDRTGVDLRNLMKYEQAKAEHAKADERVRTFATALGDAVDWALAHLPRM